MRPAAPVLALAALAACGPPAPLPPERAAEICAQRARDAAGPRGRVTVGANSRSGVYTDAGVLVTSDFLRGRDPAEVYRSCVQALAGGTPAVVPELGR